MHSPPEFSKPAYYEFRVRGRLSPQRAAWFEGMDMSIDEDVSPSQTVIRGYVEDQAALYGLISRIRDLGLTLLFVRNIDEE